MRAYLFIALCVVVGCGPEGDALLGSYNGRYQGTLGPQGSGAAAVAAETVGTKNVAACKQFVAAASCGGVDISASFSCDSYKNTACDIADYFDCATRHYACVNGQYDAVKLASANADCGPKAVCK